MNNEEYLKNLQVNNPTLRYFQIINNVLILNYNGIYKIPLNHTVLSELNPHIFAIDPRETCQIIYMLELLYKERLDESEFHFITQYTQKYLSLNDKILENTSNDTTRMCCLNIPIYKSYDPEFIDLPAAKVINNEINNHDAIIESGKGQQKVLALVPKNKVIPIISEEENDYTNLFGNAGFITLLLIIGAVIATVSYITYYIIK